MKRTQVPDERALDDLFEKYRLAPDSYVFVPLADACRKMGRLDEALEICGRGVERHPGYASGHIVKGKCLYDRGDYDRARDTFEGVLDLDDNNLVALMFLGMIDAGAGRLDDARRYFQKILAVDPDNQEIKRTLREVEERGQAQPDADSEGDQLPSGEDVDGSEVGGDEDAMRSGYGDVVLQAGDAEELTPSNEEDAAAADVQSSPTAETPDVTRATQAEADSGADRPQESDAESRAGDEPIESSAELASITLADIFASQGYVSKAARIYGEVLKKEPGNSAVRRKLAELTGDAHVDPAELDDGGADGSLEPRADLEYEIISSASAGQNAVVDDGDDGDAGDVPAPDAGQPAGRGGTVDTEPDDGLDAVQVDMPSTGQDETRSDGRVDDSDRSAEHDSGQKDGPGGTPPHDAGSDDPEKENRPEIDDTDSMSHFRRWLKQMQK